VATGQPPQGCRGACPLCFFHLVVGHELEFKQVGIFVGFLGFRREGEEQMQGKKILLLPLPRALRGRRRPIVPFKMTLFWLFFL